MQTTSLMHMQQLHKQASYRTCAHLNVYRVGACTSRTSSPCIGMAGFPIRQVPGEEARSHKPCPRAVRLLVLATQDSVRAAMSHSELWLHCARRAATLGTRTCTKRRPRRTCLSWNARHRCTAAAGCIKHCADEQGTACWNLSPCRGSPTHGAASAHLLEECAHAQCIARSLTIWQCEEMVP